MRLQDKIELARGGREVDLLVTNCRLVNVLSGDVHPASVAVAGGIVVGLDDGYRAREVLDLGGRFLAPGLIDAHVHLESSMVSVGQFARAVVPRGTTCVVTDCHEIANVMGVDGIRYIIDSAASLPLDVFVMLPSCVPATHLETSGAVLEAADLEPLLLEPSVIGLGELMNFPGAVSGDPGVLAKLEMAWGRPVDGHAPGLRGKDLSAYIAAGPDSDHECVDPEEAREKLSKGMYVFMREGTGARNLLDLIPVLDPQNSSRCCLCVDDRHPYDLLEHGHIDSMLREAVGAGVSPVAAVQMATINAARRFGLAGRGALAPGYRADMAVLEDLEGFEVSLVFKDGVVVADGGQPGFESGPAMPVPESTFRVAGFGAGRLRVEATGTRARVIEVMPGQIVTGAGEAVLPVSRGEALADPSADILKIAVVERHLGTGNVGVGFVKGFGLREGALASSVAHDSHNIVVVGASDGDMAAAVKQVIEMDGGQAVAAGGEISFSLALPIAGLMSTGPLDRVAAAVRDMNGAAADLGCRLDDPFMTMSFLALPVIPELKLTDRGLVDVKRFDLVPLFD